jgi:hypothetical protein
MPDVFGEEDETNTRKQTKHAILTDPESIQ